MSKQSGSGSGSTAVGPGATLREMTGGVSWSAGALSGAIATIAMGLVIVSTNTPTLRLAIAGLYAQQGLLAGWTAHVAHGTLFGLLFAVFLADPTLESMSQSHWRTGIAGVVYGLMLALVGAGLIMPMWLNAMAFSAAPAIPYVTADTLLWHVVYGTVIGGIYPFLVTR